MVLLPVRVLQQRLRNRSTRYPRADDNNVHLIRQRGRLVLRYIRVRTGEPEGFGWVGAGTARIGLDALDNGSERGAKVPAEAYKNLYG